MSAVQDCFSWRERDVLSPDSVRIGVHSAMVSRVCLEDSGPILHHIEGLETVSVIEEQ